MSDTKNSTIEKMAEQRDRLNARLQLLRNKQKSDERKKDTRRKILAGAHLIKTMKGDLLAVGKWLERGAALAERDRGLFGLGEPDGSGDDLGKPQ